MELAEGTNEVVKCYVALKADGDDRKGDSEGDASENPDV